MYSHGQLPVVVLFIIQSSILNNLIVILYHCHIIYIVIEIIQLYFEPAVYTYPVPELGGVFN